ncbi:ATP-binding protein [Ramlibacter sp. AN1015]|uniref:ATP-binding protein n=1 Tax=Ramlibacter sp. AN1015 TaxID=3133428 RepID=UPI0030BB31B6
MRALASIRARLLLGAAVLLLAFLVGAGIALQRAHANSVRSAHFARLQATVYLLLAAAELDDAGALVMPRSVAEPRLSLPGSGLYASIFNAETGRTWESPSTVGVAPPLQREGAVGDWSFETLRGPDQRGYLSARYAVRWAGRSGDARLVLSVLQDEAILERELGVFGRTLWRWLGGAALLLLVTQTLLLQWALTPLRRIAQEIRRIERGEQTRIEQRYPSELAALTANLNALIQQERVRQSRYKEALSFLAHSLKTPLAVLRSALGDPQQLGAAVAQQVDRMDDIVHHQLSRAAATGVASFVAPLALAPVLHRIRESLEKVYAGRSLAFSIDCTAQVRWRMDEGDAFEIFGNLMDNAAKWARQRIEVRAWCDGAGALHVQVQDDGEGFRDPHRVLQLHVRGDERVPGHGVGLAVVKDLVDSHRGRMTLGRGALGGGQVDIELPPP